MQQQLSTVRGQIDTLEGRQKLLSKESSMSSLSISIAPATATPISVAETSWDFGRTLNTAWKGSLNGLEGLATAVITVALYFWLWLPLLLVGWFLIRTYRAGQSRQINNSSLERLS